MCLEIAYVFYDDGSPWAWGRRRCHVVRTPYTVVLGCSIAHTSVFFFLFEPLFTDIRLETALHFVTIIDPDLP